MLDLVWTLEDETAWQKTATDLLEELKLQDTALDKDVQRLLDSTFAAIEESDLEVTRG